MTLLAKIWTTNWANFVWMQDSWMLVKVDNTSGRKILRIFTISCLRPISLRKVHCSRVCRGWIHFFCSLATPAGWFGGHSWPTSTLRAVAKGEWEIGRFESETTAASAWSVAGRPSTCWSLEERSRCPSCRFSVFSKDPQFGSSSRRTRSRGFCCQDRDCKCAETGPRTRGGVRSRGSRCQGCRSAGTKSPGWRKPSQQWVTSRVQRWTFSSRRWNDRRKMQEQPLDAQIRAREAFIERARKRIALYDEERAAEVSRLEQSEKRLQELRAMQRATARSPARTSYRCLPPRWPVSSRWWWNCRSSWVNMWLAISKSFLHSVFGRGRITSRPQSRRWWSGWQTDRRRWTQRSCRWKFPKQRASQGWSLRPPRVSYQLLFPHPCGPTWVGDESAKTHSEQVLAASNPEPRTLRREVSPIPQSRQRGVEWVRYPFFGAASFQWGVLGCNTRSSWSTQPRKDKEESGAQRWWCSSRWSRWWFASSTTKAGVGRRREEIIEATFRTIVSANQLSRYRAVAELFEEYESLHERTERPVVMGQSSSSLVLAAIWRTNWKAFTTRQIEQILYGCRISECCWNRTIFHDERHWRILTIQYSGLSWVHSTSQPKGWIRGNTNIGPVLEVANQLLARWVWSWDQNYVYKERQFSLLGQNLSWR